MCEFVNVIPKLGNASVIVAELAVENWHVKVQIKMYFCLFLQNPTPLF
jgi:hypothetical protein